MVAGLFELEDRGRIDVKGKAEPVDVACVLGLAATRTTSSRRTGVFVGRERELERLSGGVAELRHGRGSVWTVRGDAGTGKSRLIREFRAAHSGGVRWLDGRAYPFAQSTPFALVIDLVNEALGIDESDSPEVLEAKLTAGIEGIAAGPDVLAPIAHLYGIEVSAGRPVDRETFRDRLLDSLRRVLAALSARGPLVVSLHDLHWADPSTVELLRRLLVDISSPIMVLCNYRPDFELGVDGARDLSLSELSPTETTELVASLLGGRTPPDELVTFLVSKTEGNPFFVEEVISTLIETTTLVQHDDGWELTASLGEAGVPATVRGVIGARIDHLEEASRMVLREASVIGRHFLQRIIELVSASAGPVAPSLAMLQSTDLIREMSVQPEVEYLFKHALTQEVAYDGLSKAHRQRLHFRVAEAIEELFVERQGEFVEVLAHHYYRAGAVEPSIRYLSQAGWKSVQRYALEEADDAFRHAYELLTDRPRTLEEDRALVEVLNGWSLVYYYRGDIGRWLRLLQRHLVDAERVADPDLLSMYLGWLGNAHWFHGEIGASLETLDRAIAVGSTQSEAVGVRHAEAWRVHTLIFMGRANDAVEDGSRIQYRPEDVQRNPYPMLKGRMGVAIGSAFVGDLRSARDLARGLVEHGRTSNYARAEAVGHCAEAVYRWLALDFPGAAAAARQGMAESRDEVYLVSNAFLLACALVSNGQFEEARGVTSVWIPRLADVGNYWIGSAMRGLGAGADVGLGRLSHGMRELHRVIDDVHQHGYVFLEYACRVAAAQIHVATARRDVDVPARTLLKNPRFVISHAVPAAKKAKQELEQLRSDVQRVQLGGFLGMIDLAQAQLFSRFGDRDTALSAVAAARAFVDASGLGFTPPPVHRIAAELGIDPAEGDHDLHEQGADT